MKVTKKELTQLLQNEINWCKENRGTSDKGKDFEKGFIEGLRQGITLIKQIKNED